MPSPYAIPTALPFDQLAAAGNPYQAKSPADLGNLYQSAYGAATALNKANYGNIAQGYENVLNAQQAAQANAHAGYGQLTQDVLNNLSLAGSTQRQANQDVYAQATGNSLQQAINGGLGNSTVLASMQRGNAYDLQKANNAVAEQVANMKAGYQSNLGLAGLGFDERAIGANTALGQNQLGWMNSVQAPYPQAAAYQAVASQMGAAAQQDKDRQAMLDQANRALAAGNRAGATTPVMPGGGQGFFSPTPSPGSGGSGYSGTPINYPVPARPQFGPPPGTVLDAHPDAFSQAASYGGGYGAYTPPATGFSGGFGDQGYGADQGEGYNLAGEDQPYGQAPGAALGQMGVSPYGVNTYGAMGAGISGGGGTAADFYFGD